MFKKRGEKKAAEAERRHPRHKSKGAIACPLGKVLDLSAGGMRLGCDGQPPIRPGSAATIQIKTPMGVEKLSVRCCWLKKAGFFRGHEIGLKFIGITPELSERLGLIAKFGYVPEDQLGGAPAAEEAARAKGFPKLAEVDLVIDAYYETLELKPGADAEQVRAAYRRLVRTCHPDVCQSPQAKQKFLDIQQAYDVLRVHAPRPAGPDGDNRPAAEAA